MQWVVPELNLLLSGLRTYHTETATAMEFAEVYHLDIQLDFGSELGDDDVSSKVLQHLKKTKLTKLRKHLDMEMF